MMADDDGDRGIRVRSYVLTGGRTRSGQDLPLETMVRVSKLGSSAAPRLALERKKIVGVASEPLSIAEVSAHLMAVTPTAHWLEYVDWANPILAEPLALRDGSAVAAERPGNGLAWNEEAVARYLVA